MADNEQSIEFKIEQHSVLNDFEIVLSMGVGMDEVHHTEDLVGKGTRLSPLGLSEEILHNIHDVENKLDKVDDPNIVYGTDEEGNQTTYDKNSFGKVDDVLVDEVSVVENKIAHINLTGKVDKTDEASKIYGTDENGDQTTYDKEDFGKVDDVQLNGTSIVENKIANIEPEASDIAYTNDQYPSMHTLQDAMDKLLYITPSVSISGGGQYEIGSTRATTTLNWTWNKTIQSQSLNHGIGSLDPALRTYTYSTAITSDTTFTITGTDGTTSKSANTSVTFLPKRYWGVSAKTSLTDAEIIALSSELSTSRKQTRTFNCSGGKYFYFAIKTSYCSGIEFKVGGLSFSDMLVETRQFTNASGYTDSYNIYRVNNIQTGSAIQVEVL